MKCYAVIDTNVYEVALQYDAESTYLVTGNS